MNEDFPSTAAQPRTWLERLGLALMGEPRNREDLIEELRHARGKGLLDTDTLRMIEGALSMGEKIVADVMVPRGQMVLLSIDTPFQEIVGIAIESGHSRFPVHGDNSDRILGILLAKDLLKCVTPNAGPCQLRALLRPARMVPESKRLNELLKEFRQNRAHMAVVVDEYGGISGLVTIEDLLEEIVGQIDDEHDAEDKPETYIEALGDDVHAVQALTPIGEFNTYFRSTFSDEESDTVGGMLTQQLGHLPEVGESLDLDGMRFEVAVADDRRLVTLHVRRLSA